MDVIIGQKSSSTKVRWERAAKSKSFDQILHLIVAETKADAFLEVLKSGQVSANVYLRRLHNYARDMNWLLARGRMRWRRWLVALLEELNRVIEGHQKLSDPRKGDALLRRVCRLLRTALIRIQRHLEDIKSSADYDYRAGSDYEVSCMAAINPTACPASSSGSSNIAKAYCRVSLQN